MTVRDLPRSVWLWLPLPIPLAAVVLGWLGNNWFPFESAERAAWSQRYAGFFLSESGIVEISTVVFLVAALVFAVPALRRAIAGGHRLFTLWLLGLAAVTLYFAGEEISWGQQVFGWATPDWYMEATDNRQGETNLHNINSWFNQKPRHLFMAWVFIGGIVMPLWLRRHHTGPAGTTDFWYWFWPTRVCSFMAIYAIAIRLPEWGLELSGLRPGEPLHLLFTATNYSEAQEYGYAVFLFLYFASAALRLRSVAEVGSR